MPISSSRARSAGRRHGCANAATEPGPLAFRVPASIRSNGVAFQSEQSVNTSQNARMIALTLVPGSGLATGSQ